MKNILAGNKFLSLKKGSTGLLFLTFLLYAVLYAATIYRYDYSAAVRFGCFSEICFALENQNLMPDYAIVFDTGGYDGQFYYYIASSLLNSEQPVVDSVPFRYSRIGFSVLLSPFSLIGPTATILAMSFLPFIFHLLATYLLLRIHRPTAYFFSLNPVSLYSFSVNVSDGLALSMIAIALYIYLAKPLNIHRILAICFFTSLAVITKETMLAWSVALAAGPLLLSFRSNHTISLNRGLFKSMVYSLIILVSVIPMITVWEIYGFSPGIAAERSSLPFQGVFEYLSEPDAFFSGRSYLVIFFFLSWLLIILSVGKVLFNRFHSDSTALSIFIIATMALFLNMSVVSMATSHEYWANFGNIARMFAPAFLTFGFLFSGLSVGFRFDSFFEKSRDLLFPVSGWDSYYSKYMVILCRVSLIIMVLFSLHLVFQAWFSDLFPIRYFSR